MILAKVIGGKRAKRLVEEGAMLIDVRDPVSFRDGTLPGAVNLSTRQIGSLMREPKNRVLIFFGADDNDENIRVAANYASQFGFTDVYTIGSLDNWEKVVDKP